MSDVSDSLLVPDEAPFIDITDPSFDFDVPELRAARERHWYAHTPMGLLALRYAEAQELMRDRRLIHDGAAFLAQSGILDGPVYDWYVPMIGNRLGEDHTRLRALVNKVFTPRTVNRLRPFIRATATTLTEQLAGRDECEFVEDFATALPLAVMSELLGVPSTDYETFGEWTADIGLVFTIGHGGDIPRRVAAAVVGLTGYAEQLIADKLATPGEDLISELVLARQRDGLVSHAELVNLIVTLVFGAHDTTRHQFSNAMVSFAEHPDQWAVLRSRPELAERAVEEIIRWRPSATVIFRFVAEDFDFHGAPLAAGTFVMACVPIAHRDPRVFLGGDVFDITVARPAGVLQFGGGMYHCLGAALARAELGEALPVLAARLGAPSVTRPITWRPPLGIYGPEALYLRFGHD
jgi:cytochrome P450